MMKKRIVLIQPYPENSTGVGKSSGSFPPLGLLIIHALTPKDIWDVEIIDESRSRFDSNMDMSNISLVGMSVWTNQAPRAYNIASVFRRNGIPVIFGGPHPSIMPEEAMKYGDSLCVGEVESVWATILEDLKRDSLKRIYEGGSPPLDIVPVVKHPIMDSYRWGIVQTARGCPYNCSFCSVTLINGRSMRYRPITDVVEEFKNIKPRIVMVADDNFIGSGRRGKERAIELCRALHELRKKGIRKYWGTQCTQNLGQEDEVLEWMYKAGCRAVLFGLESINKKVIKDINKGINTLGDYAKNVQNTQRHGITVVGSFIFGNDNDEENVFEDTVDFINEVGMGTQNINISCPLPGTKLFTDMRDAGRLRYTNFPEDWEKYNMRYVTLMPKNLTALELYEKRRKAAHKLTGSNLSLLKRFVRTLWFTRSPVAAFFALLWSRSSRCSKAEYEYHINLLRLEAEISRRTEDTNADKAAIAF
jgi:radical SAM superfamily enzyme YgiQ (UPF0313 family)